MTRLGCAALLLAIALSSCSLFDYSSIKPKHYAIVYGVSMYDVGSAPGAGPNLSYPGADAISVAQTLAGKGYDEVRVRTVDRNGYVHFYDAATQQDSPGPNIAVDASNAPSKANLKADISDFAAKAGVNDVFLIYFSGHGMPDTLVPPSYHDYFAPYGSVTFLTLDIAAMVEDDELGSMLSGIQTKKRIVILDTCNSGGFIGNVLEVDKVPPVSTDPAPSFGEIVAKAWENYKAYAMSPTGVSPFQATVLSAAGKDELSWETDSYGHGVMTYYLLQGLAGTPPADLNKDGTVTVMEEFSYTKAGIDVGWNVDAVAIGAAPFEPHVSGGPVDFALY